MKKRCLIFAMVAAFVMLPLMAQAATEFTLGGYLKLATGWTNNNGGTLNFSNFIGRTNGLNWGSTGAAFVAAGGYVGTRSAFHGKYLMSASGSRFNFTIKGPELWGAKITGLFEVDFDGNNNVAVAGANGGISTASASDTSQGFLRLRHAMFRLNWPETELMLGQYWGALSEWGPDVIDGGAMCLYGFQSLREPQIRLTQKFAQDHQVALAISSANNGRWGLNLDANDPTEGESSETPKVTGRYRFEKDLWGKAPYLGALKGFVAEIGASWYRTRHTARSLAGASTWGTGNYQSAGIGSTAGASFGGTTRQVNNVYRNNWILQGTFFIPVIPTYSKNLAGTMSILTQWYVGQGLSGWRLDLPNQDRYFTFKNFQSGFYNYEIEMLQRWGGAVQAQYYFNNEWFLNLSYGLNQSFGPNRSYNNASAQAAWNPMGYSYAAIQDNIKTAQMVNANVWYRPIQALKLGLQYSMQYCDYYQSTTATTPGYAAAQTPAAAAPGFGQTSKGGYAHTLMFGGFFFF